MDIDAALPPISVQDFEELAEQCLAPLARDYFNGGSGNELTLRDNVEAYDRLRLRPRMMVDVSRRSLATEVLGSKLEMPVLVAPMAFQCLAHPDGELATARATAALGAGMVLSTLSTTGLEAVAAVPTASPRWFQLYIHRDRSLTQDLVQRAHAAGFQALCLTVDAPLLGRRKRDTRNRFALPEGFSLANFQAAWERGLLPVPNDSGLFAYVAEHFDSSLTWADLEWLASLTPLPLAVKGVLRGDDAERAVAHGANAVIVSNHGGRQLDGAIAGIDALPEVVEAVGHSAEVLVDGGIRRGTDILKALALGAKAVLVGRPVLWGLAVAGEAGAYQVLNLLKDELDQAMALSGCAGLRDISRDLLTGSH